MIAVDRFASRRGEGVLLSHSYLEEILFWRCFTETKYNILACILRFGASITVQIQANIFLCTFMRFLWPHLCLLSLFSLLYLFGLFKCSVVLHCIHSKEVNKETIQ